jgi:hypothetical protein
MSYRLAPRLLSYHFPQACGGSAFPATYRIRLRKDLGTVSTPETSFEQDEFHAMPSQRQISLLSGSGIMNLLTRLLAMGAGHLRASGYGFYPNAAICLPLLSDNPQFWQVEWHHNPPSLAGFFCDMLAWQGLFSIT